MLDKQLPNISFRPNNPVFRLDLHRLRWPRRLQQLNRYITRAVVAICLLAILFWQIGYLSTDHGCSNQSYSGYYCTFAYEAMAGTAGVVILTVLLAGLLIGLVIDLYYVNLPISGILHERDSGHWDILRLTALPMSQVVAAKYMSTQIRAWRVAAIEVGLRTAGVIMVGILLFPINSTRYISPEALCVAVPLFVGISAVYILEPVWRMRTVVAMGVSVAMQMRSLAFATLAAFGSVLAMRILQVVVTIGFIWSMSVIVFAVNHSVYYSSGVWECIYLSAITAFIFVVYFFYRIVRGRVLRRAIRLAYRVE